MITYFTVIYSVVELHDVSIHSCKLRLTVIPVSTSSLAFGQIYEANVPLLLVKNTAMNFAATCAAQ